MGLGFTISSFLTGEAGGFTSDSFEGSGGGGGGMDTTEPLGLCRRLLTGRPSLSSLKLSLLAP